MRAGWPAGVRAAVAGLSVTDVWPAVVVLVWTGLAVWLPDPDYVASTSIAGPWWLRLVYPVLVAAPLVWRRRRPLPVVAVQLVGILLQVAVTADSPEGFWLLAGWGTAVYALSAHGRPARAVVGLAVTAAGYALYTWGDADLRAGDPSEPWGTLFFGAVLLVLWLVGAYVRHRREQRAARFRERELERRARDAVVAERARLARELHDLISHNLSVLVVQAAGARAAGAGDAATLEKIERSGRESLVEMRRMLGVLRQPDDDPPWAPQPGIGHLDTLFAAVRAAGVEVGLDLDGDPAGLSAALELSVYRIVQEALTNVIRHAGAHRAVVRLRFDPQSVTVDVCDDGDASSTSRPEHTSGYGLIGMRERVALFGGEFSAGPRAEGGFAVHARLPREDPAPP